MKDELIGDNEDYALAQVW